MATKEEERRFILECIEVYRNLPALWNVKSKDYNNRAKKSEQYERLLQKYREKYPEADRSQLVKKFNCLRTNFRKELKRIKDWEMSGVGDVPDPTLWYFEEMRFVEDVGKPCSSKNSTHNGGEEVEEQNAGDMSGTIYQYNKESGRPRKKIKESNDSEKLISLVCQRLEHKKTEFEKIALTWAVDLEKMQPSQQLFAKKFIGEILFEGQMGTLHRDSVQINKTPYLTPTTSFVTSSNSSNNSCNKSTSKHTIVFS